MHFHFRSPQNLLTTLCNCLSLKVQYLQCLFIHSTGSCPHFYQTFKMLWQIFRADKGIFRYFINSYYSTRCRNISLYHLHETFSIRYHFHKTVHENTLALTLQYQGLFQNTSTAFLLLLSMFKLRCKRHYKNLATYSWCTTWRKHVAKTAPPRRRVMCGNACCILYFKETC